MERYNELIESLSTIISEKNILQNESMKNHTSFKIGGCADIMVLPQNYEQLAQTVRLCREQNIEYFLMGNGSNLLVTDKGIRGVVIKTVNFLNKIEVYENYIECEAGVLLSKLAHAALQNGLTGLEFASGIPGTLGGAVVMNAGAYDGEMKDVVIETKYIDEDGKFCTVAGEQHKFGYRTSIFQGTNKIVVSSRLKLEYGDKKSIKEKMDDLNKRRRDKQPLEMPSAGSVFRRPEGYYAGKLIQDSGLRGYSIGGAQVSEKHCGFIVNKGNATAQDVLDLIKYIQETVKSKFGVALDTEVKVIGER
ncbi:MAG: UDP-N-acetylmuramate dehydrogenase [Petroclostridium sp.]|uniref:UDP-N-acetylmuramate dehydrogenase n=1 Tax=Petroclostridium xylanilyticum TaxID=1792311 RepID=UPI001FA899D0|nr:UDP-N-acetylmuramate dehydrogenase [Petroclostridium xylanilyticum]MBZ4646610.1 UDP-N-acetylmuramate dehydrogenase [Clostridia bacterium]MDK2810607.1 UDP-N-acetylmuramate dehydrogenase [Petroclostridium sp.]